MCFVPTSGSPGDENRKYVRKKLIHSTKVTSRNKSKIAQALGISESDLKDGEQLHVVHGKPKK